MLHIAKFTFNPFQENTYIVHNGLEAILIDPGCSDVGEQDEMASFIEENALTPVRLVLTHAHIDHILGNAWVFSKYGLKPELHRADVLILENGPQVAQMYGLEYDPSPEPGRLIEQGEFIPLGNDQFEVLFVPGHAPGHIALFHKDQRFVIAGDVLFNGSIGRTDLPGGNMQTLMDSIRNELFTLGDDVTVYCGHGPETTIGHEQLTNPFLT
ncbi:MAG: MBL fold metallo-hydrolase [Bacteroidota bacterium]|nr:MBL fold metallo-hydrolase [Bacteroidota bacterium]